VRAARRVLDLEPRARFFIAGDGALRPRVEELAAQLGLGDRLVLLGWVEDVHALLHDLDVFVLTSRFEGLPRAVLQAMAAGVPVIATAVDGVPEVISDGETGRLVAPGDHRAVAEAVLELLADPALRVGLAGAAHARLRGSFEISTMLVELEALYLELYGELTNTLEEDHPEVQIVRCNLARVWEAVGRFEDAEVLYREALELRTDRLGEGERAARAYAAGLALRDLKSSQSSLEEIFVSLVKAR